MMKVPPLSLVGMERLPLPLPFSPELLWRYNPLGPSPHSGGPPSSPSAAGALSRVTAAAAAASSLPYPLATQLPFAYDIKHTIPISLASDPRVWGREDVLTFLHWCEREFDLPSFDMDRFQMNGKALCLLTKADLELRAPCSGDVIHNALQLLMNSSPLESPLTPHTPSSLRMASLSYKGPWSIADLHYAAAQQNGTTSVTLSPAPSLDGQAGSPSEHANTNGNNNHLSSSASSSSAASGGNHSDDSEYDSVGESPERSPVTQPHSPIPQAQSLTSSLLGGYSTSGNNSSLNLTSNGSSVTTISGQQSPSVKSVSTSSSLSHSASKLNSNNSTPNGEGGEYNNNGRLLWDFLQQLLNDPAQRYNSFIAWKSVETGVFKIVDPPGLARLWGIQKNHLSMNYDKMSRALRYYYRVNILRKVQGERHCYQFLRNPGELKSIKNISMLRQQSSPTNSSPVNTTVKSEPLSNSYADNDYMDDDMPTDLSMDSERHLKRERDPLDSPTDLSMESERHHLHMKDDSE